MEEVSHNGKSFIFAFTCVTVGIIVLFHNLGYKSALSVNDILPYWPVILILFGIEHLLAASYFGRFLVLLLCCSISILAIYLYLFSSAVRLL